MRSRRYRKDYIKTERDIQEYGISRTLVDLQGKLRDSEEGNPRAIVSYAVLASGAHAGGHRLASLTPYTPLDHTAREACSKRSQIQAARPFNFQPLECGARFLAKTLDDFRDLGIVHLQAAPQPERA